MSLFCTLTKPLYLAVDLFNLAADMLELLFHLFGVEIKVRNTLLIECLDQTGDFLVLFNAELNSCNLFFAGLGLGILVFQARTWAGSLNLTSFQVY